VVVQSHIDLTLVQVVAASYSSGCMAQLVEMDMVEEHLGGLGLVNTYCCRLVDLVVAVEELFEDTVQAERQWDIASALPPNVLALRLFELPPALVVY
jgi:hypothetical protein